MSYDSLGRTQAIAQGSDRLSVLDLAHVPCIHYPVCSRKDQAEVWALIDSGSEVNAMTPAYTSKLGLKDRATDVETQIDGSTLKTFGMVLVSFQVENKLGRARFFQETFLVADTSAEVILGMPFLTLSTVDANFAERELTWWSYNAAMALPITKRVQIIDRKKSRRRHWTRMKKRSSRSFSRARVYDDTPSPRSQIAPLFTSRGATDRSAPLESK